MDNFIKNVVTIVKNSILEVDKKNALLRFIHMVESDAKDIETSKKLYIKSRSCFYKAYVECIENACICCGIEDIQEQLLKITNR